MWLDDPLFPPAAGLVPLAWLGLYVAVRRTAEDWQEAFARASVGWGVLVVLLVELQSLLRLVHPAGVLASWSLTTAGISILVARAVRSRRASAKVETAARVGSATIARSPLFATVVVVVLVLGVAAWRAPVRSWDAVGYHLPRVMYWAQAGSIEHFPTPDPRPLFMNPWSAYVELELFLLAGSDRLANLVQWAAMVGCLVAAAALARAFGGGRASQLAAAGLVASIPLGIEQAMTSMIDYSGAFWVMLFALVALPVPPSGGRERGDRPWLAGGALGLALLAKGTVIPVVAPIAAIYGLRALRQLGGRAWKPLAALSLAVLLLNATHWIRNLGTFGHPIGPPAQRSLTLNESWHPRFFASNLVRHAFANLGTWDPGHGEALESLSDAIHRRLGVDDGDLRNSYVGQELLIRPIEWGKDPGGNLFHLVVFLLCVPLAVRIRRRRPGLDAYGLTLVAGALLFCLLVKYQIGIPRLQLPLFALAAPWAALVLERGLPATSAVSSKAPAVVAGLGLALAVPWVGFTESSPLFGSESIFRRPRSETAYRWASHHAHALRAIARTTGNRHADGLGLVTDGLVLEYQIWRETRRHNDAMPPIVNLVADGYGDPLPVPFTIAGMWPRYVIWYRSRDQPPAELSIQGRSYVIAGRWGGTPYALYRRR